MNRIFIDTAFVVALVNCISFVAMRENKIMDALTTDDHFKQAGFNILMRKYVPDIAFT